MITFACPSCGGKCQVADGMSGRKMKCPKCGTRIRHHADGTVELLSVGEPPPPAAAPAAAAPATAATAIAPAPPLPALSAPPVAPSPAPAAAPPTKDSTALLAHVAGEFHRQGESKQNLMVIWGIAGFFALALSATGLALWIPMLMAAPIAIFLLAALGALVLRAKKRDVADQARRDSDKTERIEKV